MTLQKQIINHLINVLIIIYFFVSRVLIMLLGCMLKWRSQLFRKWKPLPNHRRHIIDPPHRVNLTSFCPSATPTLLGPPPPSSSIRPRCPRMERGGVVAVATTKISGSIPADASVATPNRHLILAFWKCLYSCRTLCLLSHCPFPCYG